MGQKIRPDSFRLGYTKDWNAKWFARGGFGAQLEEDVLIRKMITDKIKMAGIVRVVIERSVNNAYRVFVKAAKPGLVIGRGGQGIEELTKFLTDGLKALFRKRGVKNPTVALSLTVEELKRTEVASAYIAQSVAWELEKRLPYRRAMKRAIETAMQNHEVEGIKIRVAGRLNGADIARAEFLAQGKLPLQTLRANIDYATATANTIYGAIGIKVWVYKGLVFSKDHEAVGNGKKNPSRR